MNRRGLLRTIGLGVVAVGGCLDGRLGGGGLRTTTRSATETEWFDPGGAFEAIEIGTRRDGIRPHAVAVWNASSDPREIAIRVRGTTDSGTEIRRRERHTVPADTTLSLTLLAPADYRIRVRLPGPDVERTVFVRRGLFDRCNESYTQVRVGDDRIATRTMTTELQCETP